MYRFTLEGRIGRIDRVKDTSAILRLSLAADRLVQGKDGAFTKTEWLSVVSFDQALNTQLLKTLKVGHTARLEGRIEPRKRQLGEASVTDHSSVLTKVERLATPASKAAAA